MKWLPARCRILPHRVPFYVPGFRSLQTPEDAVLAPEPIECVEWYRRFEERVVAAVGETFLPVCRFSDGEFRLLFGLPPPVWQLEPWRWFGWHLRKLTRRAEATEFRPGGTDANQQLIYSSGRYASKELTAGRDCYEKWLPWIVQRGVLGLHLSYGRRPFPERYFPALGAWLRRTGVTLDAQNYVPFYFVYGLLRGGSRRRIFERRRVLVIHGAGGDDRERIMAGLRREGVATVEWLTISLDRSLFDRIDVMPYVGWTEVCVVGAGVGKPNIFSQLEPLGCPCIDAGYVFEVWKNRDMKTRRVFMISDDEAEVVTKT